MPKEKQLRNIIRFEEGVPVNVTFDWDVASAKSFEQESKWTDTGKVTKYSVAVNKTDIIFATEALYNKIKEFKQGESAVITFSEMRWIVNGSGERQTSPAMQDKISSVETLALLKQMALDIEEIKKVLHAEKEGPKKEYPQDGDISF